MVWPLLSVITLLGFLLCSPLIYAEQRVCLDGICLGDTLDSAKVKWKDVNRDYLQSKLLLDDARKIFPTASERQQFLVGANFGSSGVGFDGSTLAETIRISPICRPTALIGRFDSASGNETIVYYRPTSSADTVGTYRVVKMERIWAVSRQEFQFLRAEVIKEFGEPYDGNEVWKYPVSLSYRHGSTAILTLVDTEYPNPDSDEFEEFSRSFMMSTPCTSRSMLD